MAAPAQPETEQPSPTPTEWALIAAILGLLVIGAGAVALARQVAKLLRVTPRAAAYAIGVIDYKPGQYRQTFTPATATQTTRGRVNGAGQPPEGPAPGGRGAAETGGSAAPTAPDRTAGSITKAAEQYYRAAFLANSSRRIQDGLDKGRDPAALVGREKALWKAHFDAFDRRALVAKRVDAAAADHGNLLGWHAVIDARTSPECARADGRNFHADRPPAIGYPDSVHPRCRCTPGAPHPGARLVDDATRGMGGSGFERRAAGG